jgi:trigger factor
MTFSDATMDDFGKKLKGAKEGAKIKGKVTLGENAEDESLRGKKVDVTVEVVEVLKEETPELTEAFLEELGDFESEKELRDFVRDSLTRQADYRTEQALRTSVVEALAGTASFELPPELVKRQTMRELERKVLELRRSGFDEDNVRRFVNATKQNAQASTESALREHFILEQIAEEEEVDAEASDYDHEISLIAEQSDQPERRVRARLEKGGQMDALRNQIVERKVIEMIVEKAKVTEEPVEKKDAKEDSEFAVYHSVLAAKDDAAIPEAKYEDNTPPSADKETERDED